MSKLQLTAAQAPRIERAHTNAIVITPPSTFHCLLSRYVAWMKMERYSPFGLNGEVQQAVSWKSMEMPLAVFA